MRNPLLRLIPSPGPIPIVGCLLALSGTLSAQDTTFSALVRGADMFVRECGRCHDIRSPLEHSDRAWVTIGNRHRARANLTGQQIRSVLAFLQATNTGPGQTIPDIRVETIDIPPVEATAPVSEDRFVIARGDTLVHYNACVGCHVVGGGGGGLGPALNDVVRRQGAVAVRRKLANPLFDNPNSMMPNFGFTTEQIDAITAYLATLGRR